MVGNLSLKSFAEAILSKFRHAVEGPHSCSNLSSDRRDIDDLRPTLILQLDQLRQEPFSQRNSWKSVNIHEPSSDTEIRIHEFVSLRDAAVVNEDVDVVALAEPLSELEASVRITKIELDHLHGLLIAHAILFDLFELAFRFNPF